MATEASETATAPTRKSRRLHIVEPVPGEPGRYYVDSHGDKLERAYIADTLEVEDTKVGRVTGTCQCKGWSVRKACTHLDDSRDYAADPVAYNERREALSSPAPVTVV